MGYIDVHCHLTGGEINVDDARSRWRAAGVERVICSGFDLDSSYIAAELAELYDEVYFTAGFHPSELDKYKDGDLQRLRTLCEHRKCVAVGECGLDYHFEDNPERQTQRELFLAQLALANELALPVVIHSRDAAQDTLELLEENKNLLAQGGLLHCYSYSAEMAERFLGLGLSFSFGGPCTFKNANKVVESVKRIPLDRILSETDCPYLTPVPKRGEFPNEPQNVVFVTQRLAELKEVDLEASKEQIMQNAKALFKKLG